MALGWRAVRAELKSTSAMTRGSPVTSTTTKLSELMLRRVGFRRVEPLVLGVVEELVLLEEVEDLADLGPAELLAVLERQLEGGALDVVDEDGEVVRVDEGHLGRLGEEVFRVVDDELVERRARGYEHGRR
jgi:hypothetical protein